MKSPRTLGSSLVLRSSWTCRWRVGSRDYQSPGKSLEICFKYTKSTSILKIVVKGTSSMHKQFTAGTLLSFNNALLLVQTSMNTVPFASAVKIARDAVLTLVYISQCTTGYPSKWRTVNSNSSRRIHLVRDLRQTFADFHLGRCRPKARTADSNTISQSNPHQTHL